MSQPYDPTQDPNSSEYRPRRSELLTDKQVAEQEAALVAYDDSLYGSLDPSPDSSTVEAYSPPADPEELEGLTGEEVDKATVLDADPASISDEIYDIRAVSEELEEKHGLRPEDSEVSEDEATEMAVADVLDGKEEKGAKAEKARKIGLVLEGSDLSAKEDVLKRFKNADAAAEVVQRVYELGLKYGTVDKASLGDLERLGDLIEKAETVESESASDVIVTEESDGRVVIESEEKLVNELSSQAE